MCGGVWTCVEVFLEPGTCVEVHCGHTVWYFMNIVFLSLCVGGHLTILFLSLSLVSARTIELYGPLY